MIYEVRKTSKFKKEFKQCLKRGLSSQKFEEVIDLLINGRCLPEKYLDHPLRNSKYYKNCRELHIQPDWLLIYKYSNDKVILYLVRTGSHSELFEKQ